jgi:hypothetical protein
MAKVTKNVESNVASTPAEDAPITVEKTPAELEAERIEAAKQAATQDAERKAYCLDRIIHNLNFSDLKDAREKVDLEGVNYTRLEIDSNPMILADHIIIGLIRAGFYHSLADETSKIKAGTPEKDLAIKAILTRWNEGYFTARDKAESLKALVSIGGKAKASAYGRQEILALLDERMTESQAAKVRTYDEDQFSGFLIKYGETELLRGVFKTLDEAAAAAQLKAAQAVLASVDDFDII